MSKYSRNNTLIAFRMKQSEIIELQKMAQFLYDICKRYGLNPFLRKPTVNALAKASLLYFYDTQNKEIIRLLSNPKDNGPQ